MCFTKAVRLSGLGLFLICFSTSAYAVQPVSASKPKTPATIVRLDAPHASALWHALMNKEAGQDEKLQLLVYGQRSDMGVNFSDEFETRRKIKEADLAYSQLGAEVAGATGFFVETAESVGVYDFGAKAYPLILSDAGRDVIVVDNKDNFSHLNNWNATANNYRIWYDIPAGIRTLEMDEAKAEKIQPQLNQARRRVALELHLRSIAADEQNGIRNIYLQVSKINVVIPGGRDYWSQYLADNGLAKLPPAPKPVVIKTWALGKSSFTWNLPYIEGNWQAIKEPETEYDRVAERCTLDLKQSQGNITGAYHIERLTKPIKYLDQSPEQIIIEGNVTGQVYRNGNFQLNSGSVPDRDDDSAIKGEIQNWLKSGEVSTLSITIARNSFDFVLTRADGSATEEQEWETEALAKGYKDRGDAKWKSADLAGALQDYNKAIEINPQFAAAYRYRASLRYRLSELDGAILDYAKATELNPEYALSDNTLGWIYFEKDAFSMAEENFTAIINHETTITFNNQNLLADAYCGLSLTYLKNNNILAAKQYYQKAIRLDERYDGKIEELVKNGDYFSEKQLEAINELTKMIHQADAPAAQE